MAKIKNISGEDRFVPWLGGRLVVAGAVIEVPDDESWAYTEQETNWAPVDTGAQKIHDAGVAAQKPAAEPAGNASREAWAAYVVTTGLATNAEIEDKSRDEIRDTYKAQTEV